MLRPSRLTCALSYLEDGSPIPWRMFLPRWLRRLA